MLDICQSIVVRNFYLPTLKNSVYSMNSVIFKILVCVSEKGSLNSFFLRKTWFLLSFVYLRRFCKHVRFCSIVMSCTSSTFDKLLWGSFPSWALVYGLFLRHVLVLISVLYSKFICFVYNGNQT